MVELCTHTHTHIRARYRKNADRKKLHHFILFKFRFKTICIVIWVASAILFYSSRKRREKGKKRRKKVDSYVLVHVVSLQHENCMQFFFLLSKETAHLGMFFFSLSLSRSTEVHVLMSYAWSFQSTFSQFASHVFLAMLWWSQLK